MLVALELDGVLLASRYQLARAAVRLLGDRGRDYGCAAQRYAALLGLPFEEQLERLFPGSSRNAETAGEFDRVRERVYAITSAHADVGEALGYLDVNDVPYVVCTTGPTEVARVAVARTISHFNGWIGGREAGTKDVQFARAARDRGVAATFIADTVRDASYAAAGGARFIGLERDLKREVFEARGLRSVPDLRAAVREAVT